MLPPQVASAAERAIKAVEKSGPDPVVFIFLSLVFCVAAPFVKPSWLVVVMFFLLLVAYCYRRDRVEKHQLKMAESRFNIELKKVQSKKRTHRVESPPIQPMLPVNPLVNDGNDAQSR